MGLFDDILDEFENGVITKEKINFLVFIKDASGSMMGSEKFVIDSYNDQLKIAREQKDQDTLVTLVRFQSDQFGNKNLSEMKYQNRPIKNVENLTEWPVGGGTPFYDAVGETILKLEKTVKENSDKDISVLVIIVTDGEENSSNEFKGPQIKEKIKQLEEEGNWTFTLLGAEFDKVFEEGQKIAVAMANTMSFNKNARGYKRSSHALNIGLQNYYSARASGKTAVKNYWEDEKKKEENE